MQFAGKTAVLILGAATLSSAQIISTDTKEILRKGEIVAGNIQRAVKMHTVDDPNFHPNKQLPEDKQNPPKMLVLKDGTLIFDTTPGQESRYLMEEIRQGVHALRSADKPSGLDLPALTGGQEFWPKLRDISCHENPGIRYFDLDGFEQFCPAK
jgi:hypothetical protein